LLFFLCIFKENYLVDSLKNKMNIKLSEKDYKKLVIEIAVKISPAFIDKTDSISAGEKTAQYAMDIANSIKASLEKPDEPNAKRI